MKCTYLQKLTLEDMRRYPGVRFKISGVYTKLNGLVLDGVAFNKALIYCFSIDGTLFYFARGSYLASKFNKHLAPLENLKVRLI